MQSTLQSSRTLQEDIAYKWNDIAVGQGVKCRTGNVYVKVDVYIYLSRTTDGHTQAHPKSSWGEDGRTGVLVQAKLTISIS